MYAAAVLTTLFAALSAAAPAASSQCEDVEVTGFTVRKDEYPNKTDVKVVFFKLSGDDATDLTCTADKPDLPSPVYSCGESKYRFSLQPGTDDTEYAVRIYHELGTGVGFYGEANVPTYCHAGGDGPQDYVCDQVAEVAFTIDSKPE